MGSGTGGSVAKQQHVQGPRGRGFQGTAWHSSDVNTGAVARRPSPCCRAEHSGQAGGGRPSVKRPQARSAPLVGRGGFLLVDLSREGPAVGERSRQHVSGVMHRPRPGPHCSMDRRPQAVPSPPAWTPSPPPPAPF